MPNLLAIILNDNLISNKIMENMLSSLNTDIDRRHFTILRVLNVWKHENKLL